MDIDFYDNEELVGELKSFIFEGDYTKIENWLVRHDIKNNAFNAQSLVDCITNKYTYRFFAFRVPTDNGKVINTNHVKAATEGWEKRVVAIIEHLSLSQQLKLLNYQVEDDFSFTYLKVLKYEPEQKNLLLSSIEFNNFITRLFHKEKFDELDKINEYLKVNSLDTLSNNAIIIYKDKSCISTITLKDTHRYNLEYKPLYDLLFNYTNKKFEYAISLGMDLPHKEQAISIRNSCINITEQEDKKLNYKNTRSLDLQRCSLESIEKYKEKCFYFDLQHKIPVKSDIKNRMKI